MASRVKEDERNERIIRGLLKLPENRRCINCNSLGPQYVCTTFWTFVCTTCSGIHREFTHRVKSVSMAKFTSQEVKALQEGGNQRTKEIYLKEWDSQRNSFPDSSNVERLRDFIKHVYVDRRYSGERNLDKPPRTRTGEKEDFYENRRKDSYQGGSRSPPYEDSERRYSGKSSPGGRSYDGGRSPGYEQESRQYGDNKRSPARPEVFNDWRRDDRFGNGRRFEERRMSDGDLKVEGRSPERPKDLGSASPPTVRPVREILGENIIPLRISEPPKPTPKTTDGSVHTQRTASSSSLASANGNPVEAKVEPSGSLIDFDADSEPPVAVAAPPQQSAVAQPTSRPADSTNNNNWASFDAFPQAKVSQAPNLDPMESMLLQLSVSAPAPAPAPASASAPAPAPAHMYETPGTNAPLAASVNNLSTFPLDGMSMGAPGSAPALPVNGGNPLVNVPGATQWPNVQQPQHQQPPSLFPATGNQPAGQQFIQSVAGTANNQPWNSSPAPNAQGFPSNLTAQAPQSALRPAHSVNSVTASQPPTSDAKSSGRQALPEDLFTFNYSAYRAPVPGWQTAPPGVMVYPMHYHPAMPVQTFQQPSKSTNPFDLGGEAPSVQSPAPTFPSMTSLQGALPNMMNLSGMPPTGMPPSNMPASGLMRTSSLGTPASAWMPQSSSYTSALPPQAPPYASQIPPSAYMGQQVPNNMLPPGHHQGVGSGVNTEDSFGSLNIEQQLPGRYSAPATPNLFPPSGGNPFG